MKKIKNIFFDLDGTIIDSHKGILAAIRFALKAIDEPIPSEEKLLSCIGPPLIESLGTHFDLHGDMALLALKYYRDYYSQRGIFDYTKYEHIDKVLLRLKQQGYQVFISTGKPTYYARQIVEEMELDHFFTEIAGSNLDNTRTKKIEILEYLIKTHHLLPQDTIIIGDRHFDIDGGKACSFQNTIGVTYGYGSREELTEAGADYLADDCYELEHLLETHFISHEPIL